ncbi:MAG: putative Holliday junction resolvase [Gammaproteobacteria bacterium]|jgi:putative Holliday junction resolvase
MATEYTALGFDYGGARIGCAIGQSFTSTASPLEVVSANQGVPDWATIDRIVQEWRPTDLVVGLPLHMDGTEQKMTDCCREFAAQLEERTSLPTHLVDERNTSREAEAQFKAQRKAGTKKRKHGGQLDSVAAKIIVERWLASC